MVKTMKVLLYVLFFSVILVVTVVCAMDLSAALRELIETKQVGVIKAPYTLKIPEEKDPRVLTIAHFVDSLTELDDEKSRLIRGVVITWKYPEGNYNSTYLVKQKDGIFKTSIWVGFFKPEYKPRKPGKETQPGNTMSRL